MQIDKRYLREAVNAAQHALTGRTDSRVNIIIHADSHGLALYSSWGHRTVQVRLARDYVPQNESFTMTLSADSIKQQCKRVDNFVLLADARVGDTHLGHTQLVNHAQSVVGIFKPVANFAWETTIPLAEFDDHMTRKCLDKFAIAVAVESIELDNRRVIYTRALWRDLVIVVAHEGKAM